MSMNEQKPYAVPSPEPDEAAGSRSQTELETTKCTKGSGIKLGMRNPACYLLIGLGGLGKKSR